MSSERLKKLALRLSFFSKIFYILATISLFLQSATLTWLTVMPNKLGKFFAAFRIYEPFVTNIDNAKISLYELSVGIVTALFVFLILKRLEVMFKALSDELDILKAGEGIRAVSYYFFIQSLILPFIKVIAYAVFTKERLHAPLFDPTAFILALLLWYIGKALETKSVEKTE